MKARLAKICPLLPLALLTLALQIFPQECPMAITDTKPQSEERKKSSSGAESEIVKIEEAERKTKEEKSSEQENSKK